MAYELWIIMLLLWNTLLSIATDWCAWVRKVRRASGIRRTRRAYRRPRGYIPLSMIPDRPNPDVISCVEPNHRIQQLRPTMLERQPRSMPLGRRQRPEESPFATAGGQVPNPFDTSPT